MNKLNILISASELSPVQGSECAEGWNIVSRLGKYHNITVLYAKGNQFNTNDYENALVTYFSNHPNTFNIEFIPIDQPKSTIFIAFLNKLISKDISSIGNPVLHYQGYKYWQIKAYKKAKELCKVKHFDIVHHLTSISFREPGFLWKLPIPFVWGPTGGMSSIPVSYYRFIGYKFAIFELLRTTINTIQFYTNIRIYNSMKKSALIYTFSKEDQSIFYKRTGKKPRLMLDAASNVSTSDTKIELKNIEFNYLSVVWCGQLIKRKALEILLYALSSDGQFQKKIKLKIIGSGPLENYYKTLSKSLNLENCIEWTGQVDRNTVFNIMNNSDLFIHSSYREATSNVIPEALSNGLPVICHDINGMSIAVTEYCGIKIPLVSPAKSIQGFKDALLYLINNRKELTRLKIGAVKRAKELSWDSMAETIANDYNLIYEKLENYSDK